MSEVMGPEVLGHSGAQKRQCPSAWSLGRKQCGNSQIEAGRRPEGEGFPQEQSPRRTGSSRPAAFQEQGPSQGPGARHRRAGHKLQRAKEGGPRRWVGTRPPRALRQHRPEGWKGPSPEVRLSGPSGKLGPLERGRHRHAQITHAETGSERSARCPRYEEVGLGACHLLRCPSTDKVQTLLEGQG